MRGSGPLKNVARSAAPSVRICCVRLAALPKAAKDQLVEFFIIHRGRTVSTATVMRQGGSAVGFVASV